MKILFHWKKSILQNRFSYTDICLLRNVMSEMTFLLWPFIRYKWLRGQYKAAGKSICIHLTLLSAVESANYFSAELKALSLRWVAKGAQLGQQSTPAEWPMNRADKGWMTRPEKADWDGWWKVTRCKEWRLKYYVNGVGSYLFLWWPLHTHITLCLAMQTVGQRAA